jgi:heat shock 70kDa protein 4
MKLLVGRKFDAPDVQEEIKRAPFKASKLPNGGVGINVHYNDEDVVVPVEHVMAMMLVKSKEIAAYANNKVGIADAVLAVPHWYSDAQRRAVLHACEIADLNCLKVADESALIALSYGIFKSAKKLFSETEPTHIMFIDIGYTCYSVSIVDFIQENMKVRSTVCDKHLGGRDFDDVIIEFLAETFQKKFGIDVRNNKKAILKLQVSCLGKDG